MTQAEKSSRDQVKKPKYDFGSAPSVLPYMGVSLDQVKKFENGRSFRFLVYGAYNAMGLIGSECNGVAILDEDRRKVICDEIAKEDTGYFGPSDDQVAEFTRLTTLSFEGLKEFVNQHPRTRYAIQ